MADRRVRDLFDRAADVPPADRAAALSAADPAVRAEVEALLAHDADETDSFLRSPLERVADTDPWGGAGTGQEPAHVGRYRVLRRLGAGGMGAVYEAEQDKPRRTVALKAIRPGLVSPDVVARFAHEAAILGRLQHPGIAQVYDAGVAADGQPYFAMEFVSGRPLDAAARDLPVPDRVALVAAVCDAVQHAHDRGVVHRDLKPGNVLVDAAGAPKVLDFGVARVADADLQTTARTTDGQLLGTPAYMSPEQLTAGAAAVDHRTDVYALGVILYQVLAGRPPLDVAALPLPEIARVVRDQEPDRLGLIDPHFRGDLETIAATALAKDPARRYASAAALAADLRRHLASEPIRARSPSALYRLSRFTRRNRAVVAGVAGVVVALAVGLAGTSTALVRAWRAEGETRAALSDVREERDRTRAALADVTAARARTRETLNLTTDRVIERLFAKRDHLDAQDRAVLEAVLAHYQEFAAEHGDTAEARALRADGLARVARVRWFLGDRAGAAGDYRAAIELFERLAAEQPGEVAYRQQLALHSGYFADVLEGMGRRAEAEAAARRALAVLEGLAAANVDDPTRRVWLGQQYWRLGVQFEGQGRWLDAEAAARKALAAYEPLAATFSTDPTYRHGVALAQDILGAVLDSRGQAREAEAVFRKALAAHERLAAENPNEPTYRSNLAGAANHLGIQLRAQRRWAEAEATARQAAGLYADLAAAFPALPEYRFGQANAINAIGLVLYSAGNPAGAEAEFRRAIPIQTQLVAELPKVSKYQTDLGGTLVNLGVAVRDQGRTAEALDPLTRAADRLTAFRRADPTFDVARLYLRNAFWARAATLEQLGRHVDAVEDWGRSIDLVAPTERADPRTRRALALARAGDHRRAAVEVADLVAGPNLKSERYYDLAGALALCAAATEGPAREDYSAQAVGLLARARATGWQGTAAALRSQPEFAALRERTDFQSFVHDLEAGP
jgi:tetratricopeptide (TPR) repeat protein